MSLNIIRKNADFRKVYRSGKSIADANLVMYILFKDESHGKRFGFSVSKKIGKAVVRNLIKRRLKEICRLNQEQMQSNFDMVLIARNGIKDKSFADLQNSFFNLAKKANLLR